MHLGIKRKINVYKKYLQINDRDKAYKEERNLSWEGIGKNMEDISE